MNDTYENSGQRYTSREDQAAANAHETSPSPGPASLRLLASVLQAARLSSAHVGDY